MASIYLASAPRQLDIVSDTVLAMAAQTPGDLSTGRPPAPRPKTPGDLSTADIKTLDRRRRQLGITVLRLCSEAGVHVDTYDDARAGRSRPRARTLDRIATALNRLAAGAEADPRRTICQALLRLVTAEFARRAGWDAALMLSQSFEAERPQDPVWLQAARLRRCAIYVLVEGLMIRKAQIGHAVGCSRQAVQKAVAAIEQERERDPQFDALMQTMMDTVKV